MQRRRAASDGGARRTYPAHLGAPPQQAGRGVHAVTLGGRARASRAPRFPSHRGYCRRRVAMTLPADPRPTAHAPRLRCLSVRCSPRATSDKTAACWQGDRCTGFTRLAQEPPPPAVQPPASARFPKCASCCLPTCSLAASGAPSGRRVAAAASRVALRRDGARRQRRTRCSVCVAGTPMKRRHERYRYHHKSQRLCVKMATIASGTQPRRPLAAKAG